MLRRKLATFLFTCAAFALFSVFALKLSGARGLFGPVVDPDLPEDDVTAALIDKQEYLKRRADYFLSLRGWGPGEQFDPNARLDALQVLEAQQDQLLQDLQAAAQKQGPNSLAASELQIVSTPWVELGPAPIPNGQTEVVATAVSGRTISIAIHPTNPNIAFVGTAQGGLYRTTDAGATWEPLMDMAESLAIGALALAPSDPNILYVGTGEANLSADSFFGVGVYRIEDALGASPQLVGPINPPVATAIAGTTAFSGVSISKIVVHPTDAATIFVSTASGTSSNPSGGSLNTSVPPVAILGLYRSTNATAAGDSVAFEKLTVTTAASVAPDTTGNRSIIDMVMEPGAPDKLVCTVLGTSGSEPADGGVYVTENALAASPTFTRTLALGAATSVDSNQGRAELAIQKTTPAVGPAIVTIYVASGESASAATGATSCGTGGTLRRSIDGGATWSLPLPAANGYCAGQCFYDIALAVDPANPNGVLLGGNVTGACSKLIARSNDGGTTFTPTNAGVHADNHVIMFAPSDPNVVYMGTDGGIYRSANGGTTWAVLNNETFKATQFQSIATHPTDRNILLGGTQDNGTIKMRTNGTWTRTDSGDGGYALFDRSFTSVTNALAYHTTQAATNSISWRRSLNSGDTWSSRNCGTNGIACSDNVLFYPPIALGADAADTPNAQNTFYYGTDRLYRSADGLVAAAVSQRPLSVDAVPPAAPVPQVLTTIAISPQNDNVRVVGLRNGKVFGTTTGSSTLTDLTTSAMPTPNPGTIRRAVTRAVVSPYDQKTAYITFGGYNVQEGFHVMKTTNLDTSAGAPAVEWTPSGFGFPDVPVNSIVIDSQAPSHLYAGTDIGVYRSTDAGANWQPFSTGLPRIAVFDLAFQEQVTTTSTQRVLRIATHGRGIWEMVMPNAPLELLTAASRKVHGAAGTFDIPLPLAGPGGVECRTGGSGGNYEVVFTFPRAVTVGGSSVTPGENGTATAAPPTLSPDGRQVSVQLSGVSSPQTLTVSITGVSDDGGATTNTFGVPMRVLVGDTTGDGTVNSGDATQTRNNSGQLANSANFRTDVNADGTVNSGDALVVRSRSGTTVNQ